MEEKVFTSEDVIDFALFVQSKDFNDSVKTCDLFDEWSKHKGKTFWNTERPELTVKVGNRWYSEDIAFYYRHNDEERFTVGVYREGGTLEDYTDYDDDIDWYDVIKWRYV